MTESERALVALTEMCDAGCHVAIEEREGARKWKYGVWLALCRRKGSSGIYYGRTVAEAMCKAREDIDPAPMPGPPPFARFVSHNGGPWQEYDPTTGAAVEIT